MTDINKIKDLIQSLARTSDMANDFMTNNWRIDYSSDLDDALHKDMTGFQTELDLLEKSVLANDLVTAVCALIMARLYSMNLSGFFRKISVDIKKVGWSKEAKLPDIPEGYKKDLIQSLARTCNITNDFMTNNWKINYKRNLDDELHKDMTGLQTELDLLEKSVLANDLVTAAYALTMLYWYSSDLAEFFSKFYKETEKVGWFKETKLPNLPEG